MLYREGGASPTTLAIPVHTHLSGYPVRAAALEEALRYMKGHDGVWWTVFSEIARLARAAVLPGAQVDAAKVLAAVTHHRCHR